MDAATAAAFARLRRDVESLKRRLAVLEQTPDPEPVAESPPEPEEPSDA